MPFRLGSTELIIVLVIVMIIFGAGKLPQVGGSIGRAVREFRRAKSDEDEGAHVVSSNGVAPQVSYRASNKASGETPRQE